jgi:hypothetical protein
LPVGERHLVEIDYGETEELRRNAANAQRAEVNRVLRRQ